MKARPSIYRSRRPGSAGFTLVEVLVALAVAGLLLALLDGMVVQFAGSARRLESAAAGIEAEDDCSRVVRLLLANVNLDVPRSSSVNLVGRRDELVVTTFGPRILGFSSPTQFRLRLVPQHERLQADGRASQSLILEWSRPADGSTEHELVTPDISTFSFAYLGKEEDASWSNEWSRPIRELRLVSIKGDLADRGGIARIEAVFPVEPTMPRPCVLDPLRADCPPW